jgi:hypothetical protein
VLVSLSEDDSIINTVLEILDRFKIRAGNRCVQTRPLFFFYFIFSLRLLNEGPVFDATRLSRLMKDGDDTRLKPLSEHAQTTPPAITLG